MSKRKPNNPRARLERLSRSLLAQSKIAFYNLDPGGKQGLINWVSGKKYLPTERVVDALLGIAHKWVIYISAFCRDQHGKRYCKSIEIAPQGIYRHDQLADALREHYLELLDSCNPSHLIGSGWVANPCGASLTEAQAEKLFDVCGVWNA